MKLLERSMLLNNTSADENSSAPFYPKTWTTALALYALDAFSGLHNILPNYNSPRLFYKENNPVADFLSGLRFEYSERGFKLKDNVVYSNEIAKKKTVRSANSSSNSAPPSARLCGAGWQKEIFFVMKLGYALEGVPSEHVYILTKYIESGNLYSNLPVLYPSAAYAELTSGHIDKPIDVISDVLNVDYEPLTMDRLFVPSYTCGAGAIEVYLPSEDKVAVLPQSLVDRLTPQDLFEITLKDNILCLHDKPLHELCGKFGVYSKGALNLYDAD